MDDRPTSLADDLTQDLRALIDEVRRVEDLARKVLIVDSDGPGGH